MKIRTAIISVVVSGALIAGGIYAAYYTVGLGKKKSVEVVPVRYIYNDLSYYYDEDSMYGTVTSRVSQNITLEADYPIEEIYVSAGDEVTEGTELFSYNMTEQEIQLEALEIEQQTNQLRLKQRQKELAKYTGTSTTSTTASLEDTSTVLTSSANVSSDEIETGLEETGTGADSSAVESAVSEMTAQESAVSENGITTAEESGTIIEDETEDTGNSSDDSGNSGTGDSGLTIESEDYTEEQYLSYVTNFESLMSSLQAYISSCGENLSDFSSEEIETIGAYLLGGDDVSYPAVTYYRSNLAGSSTSNVTNSSGETIEVTTYPLLDAVTALLPESQLSTLQSAVDLMDTYHALYVDLLINALSGKSGDAFTAAVAEARAVYDNLSGDAMAKVTLLSSLEAYEAQAVDSLIQSAADLAESGDESAFAAAVAAARTAYDGLSTVYNSLDSGAQSKVTLLSVLKILEAQTTGESESESESETEAEDVDIAARVSAFLLMADAIFAESAASAAADYQNAIAFYQMYLAVAQADIEGVDATMEGYSLSDETTAYLASLGTDGSVTAVELTSEYQDICLAYVKYLVSALDPLTMTSEDLSAAQAAYDQLGTAWQLLVDDETPSVSDYLTAYDIVLRIQALDSTSEDFMTELSALYTEYLSLTVEQLGLIWNIDILVELFSQYGLLTAENETESESETETEFFWDDSYDSYDSDDSMTAEELQETISALEEAIKGYELDIRETELELEQKQREVDKKVVTATLDGTVVSIGDEDGNSEGDYFAVISNTTGLYAKGWISELALDTVNVGDTISGVTDYGDTFTAVIKEVSEYPDPNGVYYVYSGNTNASYYAFYALIEDAEGIEEGYADLTLSNAYADTSDSIYLEAYFVRKDSTGNSYVYVEGDDGTLEMRYVTIGQSPSEYYVKIQGGLSLSDYIAFPYGDDVYEGAPTEEVDELDIYDS
ncbi:MAG: efflux RND transporter periplasmic adaptor subunit [Clostridiales bacterium]|nr:efflux RND transporter periplasmic adaptor subunit [Clostridiales bacterium]